MADQRDASKQSHRSSKGAIPASLLALHQAARPKASIMGGPKPSIRASVRGSKAVGRSSRMTAGSGQQEQRVIDEEGKDRTPKPLISQQFTVPTSSVEGDVRESQTADAGSESVSGRFSARGSAIEPSFGLRQSAQLRGSSAADSDVWGSPFVGPDLRASLHRGDLTAASQQTPKHGSKALPIQIILAPGSVRMVKDAEDSGEMGSLLPAATSAAEDSEEGIAIKAANARYQRLLDARSDADSDQQCHAEAQTLSALARDKHTQTEITQSTSRMAQVNSWELYDAEQAQSAAGEKSELAADAAAARTKAVVEDEVREAGNGLDEADVSAVPLPTDRSDESRSSSASRASIFSGRQSVQDPAVSQSAKSQSILMSVGPGSTISASQAPGMRKAARKHNPLAKLAALPQALSAMDAALSQDAFHQQLIRLHGLPLTDQNWEGRSDGEAIPSLQMLWEWGSELAEGKCVTSMTCHKEQELVAVGYGQPTLGPPRPGLLALWSFNNARTPVWFTKINVGISALDFSTREPHMLAVGLQDGSLQLYEVQANKGSSVAECSSGKGRHARGVEQVSWVDRGPQKEEMLVTCAADGCISSWQHTNKGLQHSNLIVLQRSESQIVLDVPLSRHAGALAFDFRASEGRSYLVAADDFCVHLCNAAFADHHMQSYRGHVGQVVRVRASPFRPELFLSASEDAQVKLWDQGRASCLLTMLVGARVTDVQWSPFRGTLFAVTTEAGSVQLWDLQASMHSHVASIDLPGGATCVLFVPNKPALVVGGTAGGVAVVRLEHCACPFDLADCIDGIDAQQEEQHLSEVIDAAMGKVQHRADGL